MSWGNSSVLLALRELCGIIYPERALDEDIFYSTLDSLGST